MFSFQGTSFIIHNYKLQIINLSLKRLSEISLKWDFNQSLKEEVVGQGLAFLRKSHGGCNSPPDCCQEPPFESILAQAFSEPDRPGLDYYCFLEVVGQNGLEPSTSRLSVVCSSQLSYWPISTSLVEISGIEPLTSCLQGRRSPSWAKPPDYLHLCLGTKFAVPSKLNNAKSEHFVLTLGRY